ncbi:hypothetical protein ACFWGN_01730 [Oerskovia sp. NPDC060338]|uniref:hypothetical protein n=1 Tax=Oerskovia sp. NPDC060338 TaxID=3347100 RepID=UPI0036467F26
MNEFNGPSLETDFRYHQQLVHADFAPGENVLLRWLRSHVGSQHASTTGQGG